ncbi:lysozyme [Carnobacterium maltaromaticum]|uniref:lysozyme n=1 Tax=Carnobacterium maltaromaticum TaxID=2751 RepID=UPI00026C82A2|nr:lysozyme [Carnobacterium maltaromaticum]
MANENMKISQNGRNLIKEFEGMRLTAYQDSVGVWTIGYGHTKGVYPGMQISEQQANAFLDEDIKTHAVGIFNFVTVQLNQNQFDALVSFHFNLGPYILQGSTLLTYLNNKNWQLAANEMMAYVHAGGQVLPGLVRRRKAESKLFLTPSIPPVPVIKIINLWDYTGKAWLPKIQRSYANVVSADRAFKVKTGSTWKVRLTYINYAQAVVICDQLRKVYPKYPVTGYRINVNDPIKDSTPFAVEVENILEADIENVLRHVQQTYAGIITADRIFLTPQNSQQVMLEMHNFKESQRSTIISQLKERYGINDSQFK